MTTELRPIRIVHVVYGFSMGGLENIVAQLINRLPSERYEHTLLALSTIGRFRGRVTQPNVRFIALDKPPGHGLRLYPRLFQIFRELRPDVIHTCNVAALEVMPLAWLAGIPGRVHAEHGWDMSDRHGSNPRRRFWRRLYRPAVRHYVAVSQEIYDYQRRKVGVVAERLSLIANGVDLQRFAPRSGVRRFVAGYPASTEPLWIVGTIGRLQPVKNQIFLARAFVRFLKKYPASAPTARLVIVGDGPLRGEIERILADGNALQHAFLAGERDDIPAILQMLDCFVLPSYAEGTSCTLQEAMACGLPSIATNVGGNAGLVEDGISGCLVPPDDDERLADELWRYMNDRELGARHGAAARRRAVEHFDIDQMIDRYDRLFSTRTSDVHPSE